MHASINTIQIQAFESRTSS